MTSVRLGDIVAALGGELRGDPDHAIARIAPLENAAGDEITFVAQARFKAQLEASAAGAVVLSPALVEAAPAGCRLVVVDDPYLYFARLTQWWARRTRPAPAAG
ncbi:MAG TPA: LpxD N-terminal domain-containing protein, partial [Burkholderiaceae bacterium]